MEFHVRENLAGALVGQLLAPGRNVTGLNVTGLNVTDIKAATGAASKLHFVIANQQDVADRSVFHLLSLLNRRGKESPRPHV